MNELLEFFQSEAAERLERLGSGLLALEQNGQNQQLLQDLFREAHNLKGAAAVSGLENVASVCHRVEDVLAKIRDGVVQPNSQVVDVLLAATDAVRELVSDPELDEGRSHQIIEELSAVLGESAPEPNSAGFRADSQRAQNDQTSSQQHSEAVSKKEPPSSGCDCSQAEALASGQAESSEQRTSVLSCQSQPDGRPSRPAQQPATDAKLVEQKTREPQQADSSVGQAHSGGRLHRPLSSSCSSAAVDQRSVRVHVEDLDDLVNVTGELFVAGNRLRCRVNDLRRLRRKILQALQWCRDAEDPRPLLQRTIQQLLDDVPRDIEHIMALIGEVHQRALEARMVPIDSLFSSLPRLVRQACRETGKEAQLETSGGQTRIDRQVLESLRDPLIHLVRNAVAHGIEPPEERQALGKPRVGRIRLWAERRGDHIRLVCEDDGRGIDREKLVQRAIEAGVLTPERAKELSVKQIDRLMFLPGVSTANKVSDLCGRGVGMDVVADQVARLHGTLQVQSEPGRFTRIEIEFPASIATLEGLLVEAGGHMYVLPAFAVTKILRIDPERVRRGAGGEWLCVLNSTAVPLVPLLDLLWPGSHTLQAPKRRLIAVLVQFGPGDLAIVVDRVAGMKTLVAKSLGNHLGELDGIIGATILTTGEPALIVNPHTLAEQWMRQGHVRSWAGEAGDSEAGRKQHAKPLILVVDDSVTTRMMEKSILESAGYRVDTAVNGEEAWSKLLQQDYSLVLTDIDMPKLDGFELTKRIRSSGQLKDMPVIIVTSCGTAEQRQKGMEVGANAYIVKKEFDQSRLLDLVARMTGP